jgi:hypothetical protein
MPSATGLHLLREMTANPPDGLTPVRARLRRDALALIESEALVHASYSYAIVPLDKVDGDTIHAGGETLTAPMLLPQSGELTALGVGVCTLGPQVEARTTSLFAQRKGSLALALDWVASEMLFALGRRMQDRMLADTLKQGLSMAGELRAGDPGLDISEQAAVLRLAQADRIGVALFKGHLMTPLKSTSTVLGIGKNLPAVSWSRCDDCRSKPKCRLALRAQAVAQAVAV